LSYEVRLSRQAKRALTDDLPEEVAAACFEFVFGPLSEHPYRVGKRLREPLSDLFAARRGDFRVVYSVLDAQIVVQVVTVRHRRDAYRR
jgi:mRNA interferase RelE/StbE